jgi:hypothetical protein
MKFLFILLIIVLNLVMQGACMAREKEQKIYDWPEIQPTQLKTHLTSENAKLISDIFSKENPSERLYVLSCNKGDAQANTAGEDDYYGMYQCHLLSLKGTGPELLDGEDGWNRGKSYNTRGVFMYEQLIGPCKDDPEFGFHREFNMRGMKLELTISDFNSPAMTDMLSGKAKPSFSFDLEAKITPNKSAISKYTSPSSKAYCGGYYTLNTIGEATYHELGVTKEFEWEVGDVG